MRKIKFGRMYDTDAATLVGIYIENHENESVSFTEQLYVKSDGEFFMCFHGGANTIYANALSVTQRSNGCEIIPVGPKEAREWVEMNLCGEEYASALRIMKAVPRNTDLTGLQISYLKSDRNKGARHFGVYEFGSPGDKTYHREELLKRRDGSWCLVIASGEHAFTSTHLEGYIIQPEEERIIGDMQAKRWVEDHCSVEDYISYFGTPKE